MPVNIGHVPYRDGSHRLTRLLAGSLLHSDADQHPTGHSTGLVICGSTPEVDKLSIGELDILATWAMGLSFRAIEKGFQGWSVSDIIEGIHA